VLSDDNTLEDNQFYCPEAFEAISDAIHLYPLWAAALQVDASTSRQASGDWCDSLSVSCLTNAKVEAYFSTLKRMPEIGPRSRADDVLIACRQVLRGKLNAAKVTQCSVMKKSRKARYRKRSTVKYEQP
jgi:hypothetical protein